MHRTALALMLTAAPLPALAEPVTWVIDPEHVVIAFMVRHVGYADVLGRFAEVEGSFVYDPETQALSDVAVTIDAASVQTFNEPRDQHVRSKDFLDVETQPMMTFTADGGTPTSDTTGTVEGMLSFRGQTHPVTLDVTLNKLAVYPFGHQKETIGVSIRATIQRSTWGSTYAVAGDIVGDDVDIIIELEALRAE